MDQREWLSAHCERATHFPSTPSAVGVQEPSAVLSEHRKPFRGLVPDLEDGLSKKLKSRGNCGHRKDEEAAFGAKGSFGLHRGSGRSIVCTVLVSRIFNAERRVMPINSDALEQNSRQVGLVGA